MACVPQYHDSGYYRAGTAPSITIYALKENKRPIGFAPWPSDPPEPEKPKKPRKKAA